MEKDQIFILKDRGVVLISGEDVKDFLQNIVTNDINKVNNYHSSFSSLLSPQGKYLFDFIICLLYTSPSPRDRTRSRMPSSA